MSDRPADIVGAITDSIQPPRVSAAQAQAIRLGRAGVPGSHPA